MNLIEVVEAVCTACETQQTDLSVTRQPGNDARMAAVYLARECAALPVTQLAHHFGEVSASAISKLVRQAATRRHRDGKDQWKRLVSKLEQSLRSAIPKFKVKT